MDKQLPAAFRLRKEYGYKDEFYFDFWSSGGWENDSWAGVRKADRVQPVP